MSQNMKQRFAFRSYRADFQQACLRILDSNIPQYFTPEDQIDFLKFLNHLPGPYVVLSIQDEIVGCGGWAFNEANHLGHLTWGIIDASYHGQGLGIALLHYRLNALKEAGATLVRLSTTQVVEAFFQKQGFYTEKRYPNGYGHGLDRLEMKMYLK